MKLKKLNLLLIAVLWASLALRAQNSIYTIGNDSLNRAQHIRTTDGGILLSGVNNLLQYLYFIKMDNANVVQWTLKVPAPAYYTVGLMRAVEMHELSDGSFVGALVQSSLVLKISPTGSLVWKREYTDLNNTNGWYFNLIYDIAVTDSNTIVVVGCCSPSPGTKRAWIQSMDTAGIILWSDYYSGTVSDGMDLVTKSHDGGVTVAGQSVWGSGLSLWHFSASGNLAWTKIYSHPPVTSFMLNKLIETSDHSYVIAGLVSDSTDGVIMKFDSAGNYNWARIYGDSTTSGFYDVIEIAEGYVVVGNTSMAWNCGVHGLVMCFNKLNGYTMWESVSADAMDQAGTHLAFLSVEETSSGFLIAGHTDIYSPVAGNGFNAALFSTSSVGIIWCYLHLHAQPLRPLNPFTPQSVTFIRSTYAQNNFPQALTASPLNFAVGGGCTVGIDEAPAKDVLSVYPNPSHGTITVSNVEPDATGEIYNATGQVVIMLGKGFSLQPVDVSQLPPGIYFLRATSSEGLIRVAELVID